MLGSPFLVFLLPLGTLFNDQEGSPRQDRRETDPLLLLNVLSKRNELERNKDNE